MEEWNVVVTVREGRFRQAWGLVASLAAVARTPFYNVLAVHSADPAAFLAALEQRLADPLLTGCVARVVPVTTRFTFQSPAEFEAAAEAAVTPWLETLAGSAFHVRMHRRGFKGRLSSQSEEQRLDHHIVTALAASGREEARVEFADPDYIVAVETIGQQAGLSLWPRVQRHAHPLLGLH